MFQQWNSYVAFLNTLSQRQPRRWPIKSHELDLLIFKAKQIRIENFRTTTKMDVPFAP